MKQTLLAIDDVSSILTVISTIFSNDFNIVKKSNGREGLAWLYEGNIPDIIITDLQMPELTGMEFIRELKSSGLLCRIPIVVLSGKNNSAERVMCFKLGADEYLGKPFNPEELHFRTKKLLERSSSISFS